MQVLVLGAGQLARMMALASAPLGIEIRAYDVRSHQVVHPLTWQVYGNDLGQGLNEANVVTAEFEHIPVDILAAAEASNKFLPGAEAIRVGGDRRREKVLLDKVAVPNAQYQIIKSKSDLLTAIDNIGLPLILKSALDGYDGKGQWRLKERSQLNDIWDELDSFLQNNRDDQAIIAEAWIPFDREVSVIGVREKNGNTHCYSLTQNHHHDGILILSVAPVISDTLQQQAEAAFSKITDALDYVGVLAIEFFAIGNELLVNEIAPRVHNSGHWTQQGTLCSQFENHIRAVVGLPIGSVTTQHHIAMINLIGVEQIPEPAFADAKIHPHWYAKETRPGRKMGHLNLVSDDLRIDLQSFINQLDSKDYPGLEEAMQKQFS